MWLRRRLSAEGWRPVRRWMLRAVAPLGWFGWTAATAAVGWWVWSAGAGWDVLLAAARGGSDGDVRVVAAAICSGVGVVVALATMGPAWRCGARAVRMRPWLPHSGGPEPVQTAGRVHAAVTRPWLRAPKEPGAVDAGVGSRAGGLPSKGLADLHEDGVGGETEDEQAETVEATAEPSAAPDSPAAPEEGMVAGVEGDERSGRVFRVLSPVDDLKRVPLEVLAYVVTEGKGIIQPKNAAGTFGVTGSTMRRRCSRLSEDGWLERLGDGSYQLAAGVRTDLDKLADAVADGDAVAAVRVARTIRSRPLPQVNAEWFESDLHSVRSEVANEVHMLLIDCSERFPDHDDEFVVAADAVMPN